MSYSVASGTIINAINGNLNNLNTNFQFSNGHDENAKYIQKYVRGWLRRSHYNGIKNAKEKLQSSKKIFYREDQNLYPIITY